MTAMRSVALLVLVVVAGLLVAPVVSTTGVSPGVDGDESDENDEPAANTSVADFIHASTADAENTVTSGMYEARYDSVDAETRERLVIDRTTGIEERLATLEAEREELRDRRDELSPPEYQARLTRLTVGISSLDRSIERTRPRAVEIGIDEQRFETIRQNASGLAGPEVEATVQGLTGFDRHPGGGPFDDPESPVERPDGPGHLDNESESNETDQDPPVDPPVETPVEPPGSNETERKDS